MSNNVLKGYIGGVIANVLFGFSFYFTKLVLNEVNNQVFTILSLRFMISLICIIVLYKLKIIKLDYKNKNLKLLALLCLLQPFLYFTCEIFGIKYTSTSEVGIMIAMIPVITAIMASIFLKEQIGKKQIACIIIAVLGVVFINIQGMGKEGSSMLGRILIFIANIATIVSIVAGVLLLNESFSINSLIGSIMIIGSVIVIALSSNKEEENLKIEELEINN